MIVRGGMRVFAVYFWHSEGWTQRDEALVGATVKQVRTTRRQQKAIQPQGRGGRFRIKTTQCGYFLGGMR